MAALTLALAAILLGLAGCDSGQFESDSPVAASAPPAAAEAFDIPLATSAPMIDVEAAAPEPPTPDLAASAPPPAAAATASADPANLTLPPLPAARASAADSGRIIIRTVNMTLIAADVSVAVERIGTIAREMGGWVVSSDRESDHTGFISIRVPAEILGDALAFLRQTAVEVEAESSSSKDLTDEYVDNQSRLTSLRATEAAVLGIMERARTVEDALQVQRELVQIQTQIETVLGRIQFLEQSSAYSLINVRVNLEPQTMPVDIGDDRTFSVGRSYSFRAKFSPPDGIEAFQWSWDFGSGPDPTSGFRTASTTNPRERVTATVNHVFEDDLESPYIVEFKITGTGPAGIYHGRDTLIASVTRIPSITIYPDREVIEASAGEEVEIGAMFTRPEGLSNFRARWNFGDDTPDSAHQLPGDQTEVRTAHIYEFHRPGPFDVNLTITADSEAGEVSTSAFIQVFVSEYRGFFATSWNPGETVRTATHVAADIGQAVGSGLIWIAVLSVVWVPLAALAYGGLRGALYLRNRRRDHLNALTASRSSGEERTGPTPQGDS